MATKMCQVRIVILKKLLFDMNSLQKYNVKYVFKSIERGRWIMADNILVPLVLPLMPLRQPVLILVVSLLVLYLAG